MKTPKAASTVRGALSRGDQIGPYEILERRESGGMATVYVAFRRDAPRRLVALKVAHPHLTEDTEFLRMFRNEARLAATIDHPNIVRVYDVGACDGFHYLVMEYVDGPTLARLMSPRHGVQLRFAPELAVWIAMEVGAALHVAHELRTPDGRALGVVHRDVTPHNILMSSRGDVKLIDFGIAKASDVHTRGAMKGKPAYMAPEHIRGAPVDRRADVYALGVVLWELLTGRRRFSRDGAVSTLTAVLNAKPTLAGRYVPGLSTQLESVVQQAMANDANDRFDNASAFVVALAAVARPDAGRARRAVVAMMGAPRSVEPPSRSPPNYADEPPTRQRQRPISGVMPVAMPEDQAVRSILPASSQLPGRQRLRASLVPVVLGDIMLLRPDGERTRELKLRLATLGAFGPEQTPELYEGDEALLCYTLNAFLTVALLLADAYRHRDHPLRDTHVIDGRRVTLFDLDKQLAQFMDGRFYAVVRATIRDGGVPSPFAVDDFERRLDHATQAFIADSACVSVDHAFRRVRVSARMWLHSATFEGHARRLGVGDGLIDFLCAHAGPRERRHLERARAGAYELAYAPRANE